MNSSLAGALEKLGFNASLHTSISTYISMQLPKFHIPYKAVREKDVIKFNLFFERKEHAYSCLCYDAYLRKEIVLPDNIIDNIHIKDLDEQMSLIDWNELFHKQQNIASIIDDLKKLSSSKEGKEFAEQLKVKHWCDTPLESIMNISSLRQKFEITQRFYFIDDNGISIDEAYRFLNNKWMERQLRKKATPAPAPVIKPKSKKSKSKF